MKTRNFDKYQMGVIRKSIPNPWDATTVVLIKYVTLEGCYKVFMDSHFYLLNHIIFLDTNKVNFPFFIFNSLALSINKVKKNKVVVPLHYSIIKFIHEREIISQHRKFPRDELIVGAKFSNPLKGKGQKLENPQFLPWKEMIKVRVRL